MLRLLVFCSSYNYTVNDCIRQPNYKGIYPRDDYRMITKGQEKAHRSELSKITSIIQYY